MIKKLILLILLFSSSAFATDRHVGSGQTYNTINDALSASSKGDVIIVHDGTYSDAITTLPTGTGWTAGNYTTIKALNDGGVTITGGSSRFSSRRVLSVLSFFFRRRISSDFLSLSPLIASNLASISYSLRCVSMKSFLGTYSASSGIKNHGV